MTALDEWMVFTLYLIRQTLPDLWSGMLKLNAAFVDERTSFKVTFVDTCKDKYQWMPILWQNIIQGNHLQGTK